MKLVLLLPISLIRLKWKTRVLSTWSDRRFEMACVECHQNCLATCYPEAAIVFQLFCSYFIQMNCVAVTQRLTILYYISWINHRTLFDDCSTLMTHNSSRYKMSQIHWHKVLHLIKRKTVKKFCHALKYCFHCLKSPQCLLHDRCWNCHQCYYFILFHKSFFLIDVTLCTLSVQLM